MAPKKAKKQEAKPYEHSEATSPMRPEVGTQAQFRKKKPASTFRYDSSLAPELEWDAGNPAREEGEALIREMLEAEDLSVAQAAAKKLRAMSGPFLNWSGKAERGSLTVPTMPLFIHERLSTKAIIETLKSHRKDEGVEMLELFGDPQHSLRDQILRAYEHQDRWVNRMILGDSLVVMDSLLRYESLGGQVQMIYMDPPYGVKFGSNFQPFVRRRDVKDGDDEDLTREPEMVQAYRDTWELGLHSYLTYMRDRILLARELLAPSGSVFVQISDENLHHVREVMDEVFGAENFVAVVPFRKKTMPLGTNYIEQMADFLLWYAKQKFDSTGRPTARFHRLYEPRSVEGEFHHCWYELRDGTRHRMSKAQLYDHALLPPGGRVFRLKSLEPSGPMESGRFDYDFEGKRYRPPQNGFGTTREGMDRLVAAKRIQSEGNRLCYIIYAEESSASQLTAPWSDTVGADKKEYVVQTNTEVVKRCMLMTTDPGDLVLDPTCGSGTTAYVAEQWGRRWVTVDVSRVPLALARQRLLTATFPWYQLRDEKRGPGSGFFYKRTKNAKGEETGGIVPHVTLRSIAHDEPPGEEVLVDRPEEMSGITRVTGPFVVEATIPTPVDWEGDGEEDSGVAVEHADHVSRMIEALRLSPVLQVGGGKAVRFAKVRPPAKTLGLSAEGVIANGEEKPVAFVFGPESGAVSETLVHNAAKEASAKRYSHLFVIGFAVSPDARRYVDDCEALAGIPATYVQATPDLLMGDLLKNMRSSQIFSVCGLPEIKVHKAKGKDQTGKLQVELVGLDVFDPITMDADHRAGGDVPAWFLDTNYSGSCFHVCQAFFPRTGAWEGLKKALKAEYEEGVWDHLAGTMSAPFEPGETRQIAVKVIDDRGNELLVVQKVDGQ
jgi:adenine-specific DNA-methyltransferase